MAEKDLSYDCVYTLYVKASSGLGTERRFPFSEGGRYNPPIKTLGLTGDFAVMLLELRCFKKMVQALNVQFQSVSLPSATTSWTCLAVVLFVGIRFHFQVKSGKKIFCGYLPDFAMFYAIYELKGLQTKLTLDFKTEKD
ncbi:hypothetical protein STEG23_030091, partial [Scotinomys teguina]